MTTLHVDAYPGLASFQDRDLDRLLFCGRDREAQALLNLILSESIAVLYSRSGLGKTSLINATLLPSLRERRSFPVVARLTDSPGEPRQSIMRAIANEAHCRGTRVEDTGSTDSLWEYLLHAKFVADDGPRKLVLIIDQFEELFTRIREQDLENGTTHEDDFVEELADLVRSRVPRILREKLTNELAALDQRSLSAALARGKTVADFEPASDCVEPERRREIVQYLYDEKAPEVKVVLSLREDYLPELETLRQSVPTIFQKMLRLDALSLTGARDAIVRPAALVREGKVPFTYEDGVVESMIAFLRRRKRGHSYIDTNFVDPSQLQVICQYLDRKRLREGLNHISKAVVGGDAGMQRILRRFYRDILRKVPFARLGWDGRRSKPSTANFLIVNSPRTAVRTLVEKGLITRTGYRNSLMADTITYEYGVTSQDLARIVTEKLVRVVSRLDTSFYELTHDSLIRPIRDAARQRRTTAAAVAGCVVACLLLPLGWVGIGSLVKEAEQVRQSDERHRIEASAADKVRHGGHNPADHTRAEAKSEELRARIDAKESDFTNADLTDIHLSELIWRNADLSGARLDRAELDRVVLEEIKMPGARLRSTSLHESVLWKCNLAGADASAADLTGSIIYESDLRNVNARAADFSRATFGRSSLSGADLRAANLEAVSFEHVDMSRVMIDEETRLNGTPWWSAHGWSKDMWNQLLTRYPPKELPSSPHYRAQLEALQSKVASASPEKAEEQADARNSRAWFCSIRGADLLLALDDANQAVKLSRMAEIIDTRAYILLQLNRLPEAVVDFDESLSLLAKRQVDDQYTQATKDAAEGSIQYRAALAYERVGRYEDARRALRRSRALGYRPSHELLLTPATPRLTMAQAVPR